MILKESEIDQDTINEALGKPYKEPGKWLTVTGSSYYFIKELNNNLGENVLKWEDSKGIFQRHEHGLALYINRSNYQRVILLHKDSWKRFDLYVHEDENKKELVLDFETTHYRGRFITSYSSYKSQLKYFQKLGTEVL